MFRERLREPNKKLKSLRHPGEGLSNALHRGYNRRMTRTLYMIDGMALIYRAHFALIKSPIYSSQGVNTSALFGFLNTLLDLKEQAGPDHLAIALDTPEPTERHLRYPAYKAHREEIPEDIALALPNMDRIAAALNIPVLKYPGHEADDIIGTLAVKHAGPDLDVYMVTPDKDFAQLVRPHVFILKPGRQGAPPEILDTQAVRARWEVADPLHVIDVLGLWGDASDNIPGIPGFGEKTAKKLVGQYGPIENIYAHLDEIKGKQREKLEAFKEQALLSRDLVTIRLDVPVRETLSDLAVRPRDDDALRALLIEFEFNSIGRRLYGQTFKAGRGFTAASPEPAQGELFALTASDAPSPPVASAGPVEAPLKTLADIPHDYRLLDDHPAIAALAGELMTADAFCFDLETDQLDPRQARIAGIAFCRRAGEAVYVHFPADEAESRRRLDILAPVFQRAGALKIGHHLKFDLGVLLAHGLDVEGPFWDTMIAHTLLEPDRRHGMDALAEQYLGYSPIPITRLLGDKGKEQRTMFEVDPGQAAEYAAEDADVTWRLYETFMPMLTEQQLDGVFHGIEMPLLPVLLHMEHTGIRLDEPALLVASAELAVQLTDLDRRIQELAGTPFNVNSPKQLGEVLFDRLGLSEKARKTRTGQYATDESILSELAGHHEIARLILEYREAAKLKSTYVDALPDSVSPRTGRIHTSFSQTGAVTGRLASSNPNLQNIPIRTGMGRKIRAAFVASDEHHCLLSADYSQIELRIMAELSGDPGLREAFERGLDIHAATAARVYGVAVTDITSEMRRSAKMVNFGIIYGISAFGLAQRLGIPRGDAARLIQHYFEQYPGVKAYMEQTVANAREKGYVETLSGRRRWIRDIRSANGTVRAAAERTAINTPIQGTAADMIKLAMTRIENARRREAWRTAMLLQVHDELLFDLHLDERDRVPAIIEREMKTALPLNVPVVVEIGMGRTWLEAH